MTKEKTIKMYEKIFEICTDVFTDVKFARIYNFSKEMIIEHKKEIRRREYDVISSYFDLQEAKGNLLLIKK